MYPVDIIASYIIDYSCDNGKTVSNLRLQKILYFVQAEFLVDKKIPCFAEEIYAWSLGPVVPSVYFEYKKYGGASIPSTGLKGKRYPISIEDMKRIEVMVDQCNTFSTTGLVQLTHDQDPWKIAINMPLNKIITKQSIFDYFSEE